MQQRDHTITLMKAIAIICMVAGHAYTKSPVEGFVGMFHMPVFFVCSGFCFKEKYLNDSRAYIKRKIRTIWWPTVKWIIALIVFHNILLKTGIIREEVIGGIRVHYYTFMDYLKYSLMGATLLHSHAPTFAGVWFLKMLLFDSIVGFYIIKYVSYKHRYRVLLVMLILSITMLYVFPSHVPVVDQAHLPFLSLFFFLIGYYIKKDDSISKYRDYPVSVLCCSFILLICGFIFWRSSMVSLTPVKCILFCISAFAGVGIIFMISKVLICISPPRKVFRNY